jgi:hypothetical protein
MDLTGEQVESIITQIICGGRIEVIKDKFDSNRLVYFRHPLANERVTADFIKAESFEKAISEGLLTLVDMEELLVHRGIWGIDKDKEIDKLNNQLKGQRVVLSKTTRVPANRQRLLGVIKTLEEKIWSIRKEKEIRLEHTVERKAEEEKLKYFTWACTYSRGGEKRYWEALRDFEMEPDFIFRRNCVVSFSIFSVGTPNSTIRYIARSPSWRIRYTAAQKNGGRLFKRDISDYSIDMLNLMYWSGYYSSIYEMLSEDRPSDDIIEDDESLDAYMEEYFKEQSQNDSAARAKKTNKSNISAWDHDETIVMRSNPIFEDVEYSETTAKKLERRGKTDVLELSDKDIQNRKF